MAARHELKQRFGYTPKTYVIDDLLVVACNDTTEQLRRETTNEFLRAFGPADDQTPSIDDSGWRFHWRSWSTL